MLQVSFHAWAGLETLTSLCALADFQTSAAGDGGELDNISNSQSSQVAYADLSHNEIKRLRELEAHKRLVTLILAHNQISSVIGLSHLTRLQTLDLRHNSLSSMYGIGPLPALRELLLDGNSIDRISGLHELPALNTLSLRGNRLQSLDGIQDAQRLVCLDVADNAIDDIYALEPGMALPFIAELQVLGNPLCMHLRHVDLRIIHRLPGLTKLNGVAMTAETKVNAANLHGADMASRRRIFHRVLPDQMFTDPTVLIDPVQDARRSSEAMLDRLAARLASEALEEGSRDTLATHGAAMGAAVFRSNHNSPQASRAGKSPVSNL